MATKPKADLTGEAIKATGETPAKDVYTVDEIIEGYTAFGTSKEIVTVAIKLSGIKSATFDEAKKLIDDFKNKEV